MELLFLAFVHVVIDTAWSLNCHMDRLTHVREMWLIIDPLVLSGRLELLMAHIVVSRYLSYSTTLAEHAFHCLRRCPAFGRQGA